MVGRRCLYHSARQRLTLALPRSVAFSDFFMREAETLQEVANCRVLNLQAGRIGQGIAQLKERNIWVLSDQLFEKRHMRSQLARSFRSPLRRRSDLDLVSRMCRAHRAPVAGENFKRNSAARPLNPSSI